MKPGVLSGTGLPGGLVAIEAELCQLIHNDEALKDGLRVWLTFAHEHEEE